MKWARACARLSPVLLIMLCGAVNAQTPRAVVPQQQEQTQQPTDCDADAVRIGIFYIAHGATGVRHLSGIKEAFKEEALQGVMTIHTSASGYLPDTSTSVVGSGPSSRKNAKPGRKICIIEYPYINDRHAVELYRDAIGRTDGQRKVDIILGPTESDVFLRLREEMRGGSASTQESLDSLARNAADKATSDLAGGLMSGRVVTGEATLADEPAAVDGAASPGVIAASGAEASGAEASGTSNEHDGGDADDASVPVISGLVTTVVGNEPSGWFFRTNVDVTRRAKTMYRFLNKYWIHSIAVFYANTDFGTKSQAAFAEQLSPWQKQRYLPLIYDAPPDPSDQLHKILEARPDAVGFFGERDDIEQVYRELRELNGHGTPYRPIFFTLVDSRSVHAQVEDLLFVSIASREAAELASLANTSGVALGKKPSHGGDEHGQEIDKQDDVVALGHDTAVLVLEILKRIPAQVSGAELRRQFRDRLATRLQRSKFQDVDGLRTWKAMSFINFTNSSPLSVLQRNDSTFKNMALSETIPPWSKLIHRVSLIFGVWGWWPLLSCVLVIFAITGFVVHNELRTLFEGTTFNAGILDIVGTKYFWRMSVVHLLASVCLYIVFAEMGRIQYNDFLMAAIIAAGPWALLKSLLDTPIGEKMGLKQFYDGWKTRLDKEFMHARFSRMHAHVSVIAYHNSMDAMRKALLDLYREHPSGVESSRLTQELEHKLQGEGSYFERRRICARLLLKQKNWEQLKADGLVPARCGDPPMDPRMIVRAAAKHCSANAKLIKKVQTLVRNKLKSIHALNPKRHEELQDFLKHELESAKAPEAELFVRIRFLFVLFAFDLELLKNQDLISLEDYQRFKRSEIPVRRMHAHVNVIAYRNPLFLLRQAVLDIYQSQQSRLEGSYLARQFEREFKSAKTLVERRRVCARRLLQEKNWEELQQEGLVPRDVADPPRDPEEIIIAAARYCSEDDKRMKAVRELLDAKLADVQRDDPKRFHQLRRFLRRELSGNVSPECNVSVWIRFLFLMFGYNLKRLWDEDLINDDDYERLSSLQPQQPATGSANATVARQVAGGPGGNGEPAGVKKTSPSH